MVPNGDDYIEDIPDDVEDLESGVDPGSTSQFGPSTTTPTVIPGQSLMPTNNIRHITLDAERVLQSYILIHVTKKPSLGSGSGYDEAILITDTTGDGINFDSYSSTYFAGTLVASYSSTSTLINSPDATQRTYDVTFASGVVRSFTLTIPGKRQSFEFLFGTTGSIYNWDGYTGSCNLSTGVNWTANFNSNSHQTTVNTGSIYGQTWPLNDPSNIYYSGDASFDITSSQVFDLTYNTEDAGSLINQAFADGFLRNSNNNFSGYGVPDQTNSNIQTVESYIVYLTDGFLWGPVSSSSYNSRENIVAERIGENRQWAGQPTSGQFVYNQIGFNEFKYSGIGSSPRFPFMHSIVFSENLQSCVSGQTIDACSNINSANYIGYDGDGDGVFFEDCDGNAISSAIYTNPNTTYTDLCCPDCTEFVFSATGIDPTTNGGTDGVIELSVDDGLGVGSGTANYTFVIEPLNNINAGKGKNGVGVIALSGTGSGYTNNTYTGVASTTSGSGSGATFDVTIAGNAITVISIAHPGTGYAINDTITLATATVGSGSGQTITINGLAGIRIGSGAVSHITFTFGYQTDLAQDNVSTTADPTYATSSAVGYIPRVTDSGTSTRGLDPGQYKVYVFDTNATAACLAQTTIILINPPLVSGCTDSASLTYDANANINNPGACWYCDAANGLLENGNNIPVGGNNGSIINPGAYYIASATGVYSNPSYHLTTVDTTITVYVNCTPENSYWIEALQIVDASGIVNGETKIELYRWDSQTATGNSAFNTLVGFNAGTTIVGGPITQPIVQGGGFHTVFDGGAGGTISATFTYGYYSVKWYVNDPDGSAEVEECYALMDVVLPCIACENTPGIGIAQDGSGGTVLITDTNLYVHDNAVCLLVNNFCCDSSTFAYDIGDPCAASYTATAICTDEIPVSVIAEIFYKNVATSGVWFGTTVTMALTPDPFTGFVSWSFTEAWLLTQMSFNGEADFKIEFKSYYPNSNTCVHFSPELHIIVPMYGCTDPNGTTNYNPLATCDDGSCEYCIYGCTNEFAFNYDPSATCDDGSCIAIVLGCTDPSACNYNENANTDDGSCYPCVYGCTDSSALNYDPSATTEDGSCFYCTGNEPILTVVVTSATAGAGCVSNADGSFSVAISSSICNNTPWFLEYNWLTLGPIQYGYSSAPSIGGLVAGNYSITVTDCYGCTITETVSIPTDNSSCGCTDPAAENYCATCTIDDGTCLYCGCDDPNATNYDPNAFNTCSPNPCTYYLSPPPCIPTNIDVLLDKVKDCISVSGFEYYNKLVTGLSDDCSIMNSWKLILIDYLLNQRGLPCVYNCADTNTPDASEVYISCNDLWITGGPHTGLNDINTSATVGTTSTATMFTTLDPTSNLSTNGQLFNGDVIKHHVSGNIWIFKGPPITNGVPTGAVSVIGLDPETASGTLSGYWEYCTDSLRYTENTYNINYLDNFINFVNTFCEDCGNKPQLLTGSRSGEDIPDIQQGIDGIDDLEI